MTATRALAVPELGPLLGRLARPSPGGGPALLEPVRLGLLTDLFERAGQARRLAGEGDHARAAESLGPAAWMAAWEHAVAEAARMLLADAERSLRDAAALSRIPGRKLHRLLPGRDDRTLLEARLASAGIGLEELVERLSDPERPWGESLRLVAGQLEQSWDELAGITARELTVWRHRSASVAAWRPPWRPYLLVGALLLVVALWLGLVLGGYLPVPGWLRPLADWYWQRPWA